MFRRTAPAARSIMRLSDQRGMSSKSVLGLGRFAGKTFEEMAVSYRTWALREVDNPSEDLVIRKLVACPVAQMERQCAGEVPDEPLRCGSERDDPLHGGRELDGILGRPPAGGAVDAATKGQECGLHGTGPQDPTSETTGRRTSDAYDYEDGAGDNQIPPEVDEEVRYLERLALLKEKHGIPARIVKETPCGNDEEGLYDFEATYHSQEADGDDDTEDEGTYDEYLDHLSSENGRCATWWRRSGTRSI